MKLKKWLLTLALPVLAMVSCLDDKLGPDPSIAGGTMQGSVDGSAWAAEYVQYARPSATVVQFLGGRDNGGTNPTIIAIELKSLTDTGVYMLGNDTFRHGYLMKNNVYYKTISGQVNVTQDDSLWFKAAFTLIGQDTVNLDQRTASGIFQYKKK